MHSTKKIISIAPRVIAHRGASARAPENTLAAFRQAKAIGAAWVEFDVMLAACGEAVVIHDETLERTTNGVGRVADFPYSYLQTLDAGSWFAPQFRGEKIPTLIEVLDLLHELKLMANIEIKPCVGQEAETVKEVMRIIAQHWRAEHPPLISSFSRTVLADVRVKSATSLLGFLMHEWQDDWHQACDDLNCVTVNVNEQILDRAKIADIKASNRLLLSYTVDDTARAQELFSFGVDAVFSNCPASFLFS